MFEELLILGFGRVSLLLEEYDEVLDSTSQVCRLENVLFEVRTKNHN